MIINRIEIARFRGFQDVEFNLGTHLTAIAGQNGTQKTTLLGLLSQPFTINEDTNPLKNEKPVCGGSFKSAFKEKFKLSDKFDKPKKHEWTLHLSKDNEAFTVESMPRSSDSDEIRFWKKGDREKGSGYIQLPVIYLSLKRLLPIGEDENICESKNVKLTVDEIAFYQEWHNRILIITEDIIQKTDYLASRHKNTLGASTDYYDWKQNSAGQDNIGKILLAILSFKRLKEAYANHYEGGILVIDELDATLYPASQIKLLQALRKFASDYKIQVIFTTHSLTLLEKINDLQKKESATEQIKVIFLERENRKIKILKDISYNSIKHKLNVSLDVPVSLKLNIFTEDKESSIFAKALLKRRTSKFIFIDCPCSCSYLIDLSLKKVPSFIYPNSIIIVDGDVKKDNASMKKIGKATNIICLPTKDSPERILAEHLFKLDDTSHLWDINPNFNKQYCFQDISINEIRADREKAKKWFNFHLDSKVWGRNASKIINHWIKNNPKDVDEFLKAITKLYGKFAKELAIEEL